MTKNGWLPSLLFANSSYGVIRNFLLISSGIWGQREKAETETQGTKRRDQSKCVRSVNTCSPALEARFCLFSSSIKIVSVFLCSCKYRLCLAEDTERGKGRLREELKSEGKIPLMIHFCAWNLTFKVQTSFKGIWLKLGEFSKGFLHTEMDNGAAQHLQGPKLGGCLILYNSFLRLFCRSYWVPISHLNMPL